MKWLFIVHQVQTRNSRERVKVWRLTKRVGAILYRNSVYVLPYSKERLEDLQWLSQQIRDAKGEASVFVSESDDRKEDAALRSLFDRRSGEEYSSLLKSAGALTARARQARHLHPTASRIGRLTKESKQLHEEFSTLRKTDFFDHPFAADAKEALSELTRVVSSLRPASRHAGRVSVRSKREFRGKTWSTREHIHIDRVCSAWLIRRFIDPQAKFIFAPETKLPRGTIQFDVMGAEFGHHDDHCTFETLLAAFQLKDRALGPIAQIVHDIDLKDRKFGRPEADGIDTIIRSLSDTLNDDRRTLEVGSLLLDALYQHFAGRNGA